MATAVSVLKRAPLGILTIPSVSSLLEQAGQLVGYQPEYVKTREQLGVQASNRAMLAQALTKLGIQPLTLETVRTYKQMLVDKAESRGSSKFVRTMHNDTGEGIVVLGCILSIIYTIVAIYICGRNTSGPDVLFNNMLHTPVGWAIGGVWGIWAICMFARHKEATDVRAVWHSSGIGYYTEPIPEFAIADMLALKKVLPETAFSIEEFQTDARTIGIFKTKPLADPFLIAHYKGISVYLHVWDEPDFEGVKQV